MHLQGNVAIIGNGIFQNSAKGNLAKFKVTLLAAGGLDTAIRAFFAACGFIGAVSSFLATRGTVFATGRSFLATFCLLAAGWFLLAAIRGVRTEAKASCDKQRQCKNYEHLLHGFDSFVFIYQFTIL